jgi:hypothetical protein
MKQSPHPTQPTDQEHHAARPRPLAAWVAQIKGQSLTIWKHVAPVSPPNRPTSRASILQTGLQVVLWAAFGAFLFASLPHVAYFFAAFEPESSTGTLNDYWWFVSYGLADEDVEEDERLVGARTRSADKNSGRLRVNGYGTCGTRRGQVMQKAELRDTLVGIPERDTPSASHR